MLLSGGGFSFPARDNADWLMGWFLSCSDHHAMALEQSNTEKGAAMRRRERDAAFANAIAFASIDPKTLYDTGDLDCRRWRRLMWIS